MPIYEYNCPNCRNVFEIWQKISESSEEAICPRCAAAARRMISNTAFVLKGGGWYVTDYGYRKGTSEDGAAPGSAASTATDSAAAPAGAGSGASPAPATPASAPAPAAPTAGA